uniref:Uncharacterized protein n=1 Tax=Quercus lobata TaxID=97700 RepID=A0A7N2N6U3_QUELO
MDKSDSFKYHTSSGKDSQNSRNSDFGLGSTDRRLAFSRQASFAQSKPLLSRSVSSIDIPPGFDNFYGESKGPAEKLSVSLFVSSVFRILRTGNRYMKRLFLMISLNVAYSTSELAIGLFTGRVDYVPISCEYDCV